jgi:hypothetical protein
MKTRIAAKGNAKDATTVDEQTELEESLTQLRSQLERGDVEGAREFVGQLAKRWPASERVDYWALVLAPPVARIASGARGRPLDRERAWLKAHAQEYPGCWLAVYGDRLIASDPDLRVVLAETRKALGAEGALLHFQGPTAD